MQIKQNGIWFASKITLLAVSSLFGMAACDSVKTAQVEEKSHAEMARAASDAEAAEEQLTRERRPASKVGKVSKPEAAYIVQVGTFRVEANAQKVLKQLKEAGLPAFQKRIERGGENVLYAVRFEPTPSKTEAEKFVESAKSLTGQKAMILSLTN